MVYEMNRQSSAFLKKKTENSWTVCCCRLCTVDGNRCFCDRAKPSCRHGCHTFLRPIVWPTTCYQSACGQQQQQLVLLCWQPVHVKAYVLVFVHVDRRIAVHSVADWHRDSRGTREVVVIFACLSTSECVIFVFI